MKEHAFPIQEREGLFLNLFFRDLIAFFHIFTVLYPRSFSQGLTPVKA
jgi:hypothetical protein